MAVSKIRQNYHEECESAVNKQINLELYAHYTYLSMAYYFARDDVALHGCYKFFKHNSNEEQKHAEKLMEFQNKRGGKIILQSVNKPVKDEWGTAKQAMEAALELEKNVNQSLLNLHQVATDRNDPHLMDFIEEEYLREQVDSIKEISDYITQFERAGPNLGEYMVDHHIDEKLS